MPPYPAHGFHSSIPMPTLALRLLCVLALLVIEQAQAAEVVVHASRQGEMLEVEAGAARRGYFDGADWVQKTV